MSFYLIIRGPLGCGKSTISKELAGRLKAEYISVDEVLRKNNLEIEKEEGYFSQNSFKKANEILAPRAIAAMNSGRPVIIDGNFYWPSQIDDLVQRLDFPHYIFTLKAPLEVCIARDRDRPNTHYEDAVRAVYKKTSGFDRGTIIDIRRPLPECLKEIISHLPNDTINS